MWTRRIAYLSSLLGALVFYGVYREWFSCLLLWIVIGLPWLSLLLSLPAMCTARVSIRCPKQVQVDTPAHTALQVDCKFPVPRVKSKLHLHNLLTGARYTGSPGDGIPTRQCGCMVLSWDKIVIFDYLGLFRKKVTDGQGSEISIFPKPVKSPMPSAQTDGLVYSWRAKPGGGFSENRELRLYRPGDNLRHIHWKLTAKTQKLIYAEPIEPVQQGYLLSVCLSGNLEDKLGRLLYISRYLLSQDKPHQVQCKAEDATVTFSVVDNHTLQEGMAEILRQKPAKTEQVIYAEGVLWHHHIGGDGNET